MAREAEPASPDLPGSSMPSGLGQEQRSDPTTLFATARGYLAGGQQEQAAALLRHITQIAPQFEAAWLQLLSFDPPPDEEIELLEGFLKHHPQHRFARAFHTRLDETRIIAMLRDVRLKTEADDVPPPVSPRIGDYLIKQQWVTSEQVEQALAEQRALREAGFEQRLGTILLMQGHLKPEQLASALAASMTSGFGEFGDYLVRTNVLTREQVAMALARQAAIRARLDHEYLDAVTTYSRETRPGGLLRRLSQLDPRRLRRREVPMLGEIIVSMGLLTVEQVEQILEERRKVYESLFD